MCVLAREDRFERAATLGDDSRVLAIGGDPQVPDAGATRGGNAAVPEVETEEIRVLAFTKRQVMLD